MSQSPTISHITQLFAILANTLKYIIQMDGNKFLVVGWLSRALFYALLSARINT